MTFEDANGDSSTMVANAFLLQKRYYSRLLVQHRHSSLPPLSLIRRKLAAGQPYSDEFQMLYIKESEELRRAMEPIKLIKRVREISIESYEEPEQDQEKDAKQTAAVGLISRINNFRANSDTPSLRALEEWRKRKIEPEKKRGNVENTTTD